MAPKHRTVADDLTEEERAFVARVWQQGRELYRDLPWRNTRDPYEVLVSEVMLQQTQVVRVQRFWPRFLEEFPTLQALARGETARVLELWQGLGYNRRALALQRCAVACVEQHGGWLPQAEEELLALPGIGAATAGGVRAFAFGLPGVYLETNVRTVFLHELFPGEVNVPDKQIIPLVARTCSADDPRAWYYALLDLGAHLKANMPNPSRRSRHHSIQSKFEGSRRQKRAELVRVVLDRKSVTAAELQLALAAFEEARGRPAPGPELATSIAADLTKEGFLRAEETPNGMRYFV